jgi:homoserine kinase
MGRRCVVRVPASSANLGPGFDAFAAALALHLEAEVEETGRFAVETDLAIARDRRNLLVRGFARLHPPDRFTFRIRSAIPLSGGLGSSAAAYVAGLTAADALVRGGGGDLLAHAAQLEGHPDNVAAALRGGLVICADGSAVRLDPPAGLEALLVVPREAVRTAQARAALPATVPMGTPWRTSRTAPCSSSGSNAGTGSSWPVACRTACTSPTARTCTRARRRCGRARRSSGRSARRSPGAGPTVLVWCLAERTAGSGPRCAGRPRAGPTSSMRRSRPTGGRPCSAEARYGGLPARLAGPDDPGRGGPA